MYHLQHILHASELSLSLCLWYVCTYIGKNRRNSIKFLFFCSLVFLFEWFACGIHSERVWKRDAKPCRNCAIKRSEVSAHIFNTIAHWRSSKIINSHLKRCVFFLSFSRLSHAHNITNGHNIAFFSFSRHFITLCVYVIVSFIHSALWYSIKKKKRNTIVTFSGDI